MRTMYGRDGEHQCGGGEDQDVELVPQRLVGVARTTPPAGCERSGWPSSMTSSRPMTNSGSAARPRVPSEVDESNQRSRSRPLRLPMQDRQRDADEGGQQHEDGRVADPVAEELGHRLLGDQRLAHVAGGHALEPVRRTGPTAGRSRPSCWRTRGQSSGGGVSAEDGASRVAGQRLRGGEHQERDEEQRQHSERQAADDDLQQRWQLAPTSMRVRAGPALTWRAGPAQNGPEVYQAKYMRL